MRYLPTLYPCPHGHHCHHYPVTTQRLFAWTLRLQDDSSIATQEDSSPLLSLSHMYSSLATHDGCPLDTGLLFACHTRLLFACAQDCSSLAALDGSSIATQDDSSPAAQDDHLLHRTALRLPYMTDMRYVATHLSHKTASHTVRLLDCHT
jgi:hypothetical protein